MQTNREWISMSDLMAGLMMVFLFISVAFMIKMEGDKNDMAKIALVYEQSREKLNRELHMEFDDDLVKWDAEILHNNTVRFRSPEILFARSSSLIRDRFRDILGDFFPRYIAILIRPEFKEDIEEVRIEGHTSSIWRLASTADARYLNNAALSQERSFSVLRYVYSLDDVSSSREWLSQVMRANGLSYAKRIFKEDGGEDFERSRRVEFRVVTKAEDKIYEILEESELHANANTI